jgi:tetratricopeptide (TPR) repeat protein
MKRWTVTVFVLIATMFGVSPSDGIPHMTQQIPTEAGTPNIRRRAIVVGASQYRELPALPQAALDAQAYAQSLQAEEGLQPESVKVLVGDQATLHEIRKAFDELRRVTEPLDLVYVYFAGYGVGDGADGYLLPTDVRVHELTSTSLSLRELRSKLEDNTAKNIILIVNAAYDDRAGSALKFTSAQDNQLAKHLDAIPQEFRWVSLRPAPPTIVASRPSELPPQPNQPPEPTPTQPPPPQPSVTPQPTPTPVEPEKPPAPLRPSDLPPPPSKGPTTGPTEKPTPPPTTVNPTPTPVEPEKPSAPIVSEPPPKPVAPPARTGADEAEAQAQQAFESGLSAYNAQRYAEAIQQFTQAVKLDHPKLDEVYFRRGLAYQQQGNLERAIDDYHHAIRYNPRRPDPRRNLARILEAQPWRQFEDALGQYQKVHELTGGDAFAFWRMGYCNEQLGRAKDAALAYQKALELDPTGAQTGFDPARLRQRIRELKK